jgi:hypothetical protein
MNYAKAVQPLQRRISKIVDKLIEEEEIFREIDKTKLMESLSRTIERLPKGQLESISDRELARRLEKVLSIEVMSGLLKDLSPEQIEAFDEAVKRREFF